MKETDLYEPVAGLFSGDIYPEVVVFHHRPDIVIRNRGTITVVEMKTSLSLALIEQAYNWVNKCDNIYVAVPHPKKVNDFAVRLLADKGIGVILVRGDRAHIYKNATQQERNTLRWDNYLHEFYKQNESGGTNGEYMTSYKYVIQCVREYLESCDQSQSIKDIVDGVDCAYDNIVSRHYREPQGSLRKALTEYETSWCRRSTRGGRVCFSTK